MRANYGGPGIVCFVLIKSPHFLACARPATELFVLSGEKWKKNSTSESAAHMRIVFGGSLRFRSHQHLVVGPTRSSLFCRFGGVGFPLFMHCFGSTRPGRRGGPGAAAPARRKHRFQRTNQ